jgi:hypothetical protein
MSLYPGAPRFLTNEQKYVLDDIALNDSMAKAIEDAMNQLFQQIKGEPLPETGKADRRILFVAIARGILQYFTDHLGDIDGNVTVGGTNYTVNINLNITMNR